MLKDHSILLKDFSFLSSINLIRSDEKLCLSFRVYLSNFQTFKLEKLDQWFVPVLLLIAQFLPVNTNEISVTKISGADLWFSRSHYIRLLFLLLQFLYLYLQLLCSIDPALLVNHFPGLLLLGYLLVADSLCFYKV